ncbi:site-specific integrase [Clostridium butyricum]|uniref:site-specific integrase n=1 Tax=Clostridium butyricum TaxID=1492 RepID=UPI002AAF8FD5|nr:site-specific integrase [Clostridium butyricum]
MASYKQLSKGNWKVIISLGYDNNGKRKRIIKQGFRTKKDAELFVTETLNKRNRGYISPSDSNMLFKDYIMKWFNEYKCFQTKSINTRNNYLSRIDVHIIPKLGSYKLNKLNTAIIQDFYNSLIADGLKPSSAKKIMETVSGCLKYAKKNKLIYELPTDIEKQKIEKPKIEYWSKEEADFFLNYIKDTYLYTPVFIDMLTGLRIGELCGLRWCDVNLENGFITVNHQLIHDKRLKVLLLADLKTSSSHRVISIPKVLINYLKQLKEQRNANKNDYIVLDKKDFKYTPRSLSMNFTKKVAKFALPIDEVENKDNYMQLKQISFHGLRHTHATILIANGENIKVVSERLGHTDIKMTLNTYTHVLESMRNNTANLLDKIFE